MPGILRALSAAARDRVARRGRPQGRTRALCLVPRARLRDPQPRPRGWSLRMSDAADRSALIDLVGELAKQREDEARRLQEEVPVLTDVIDGKQAPVDALDAGAQSLAKEIEHE